MPKGSEWKLSASHLLDQELRKFWNAFEELKNWGMWQEEYGNNARVNWIQSFIQDELIKKRNVELGRT